MATSKRTFGVEIECGHPNLNYARIGDLLTNEGFDTRLGPANSRRYGIGYDGSGIEVRTPILKGDKGFRELTKVMDFLHEQGCYVTRSDGMHVHIGAEEFTEDEEACTILARTWYNNQGLIGRMCSSHRSQAHVCLPLKKSEIEKIGKDRKVPGGYTNEWVPGRGYVRTALPPRVAKHWGARYKGLNYSSLPEHGTVEFRLHEGCLDPVKAVAWIRFCQALVDHTITTRKVLKCASKIALLRALDVPETEAARLSQAQKQMPKAARATR